MQYFLQLKNDAEEMVEINPIAFKSLEGTYGKAVGPYESDPAAPFMVLVPFDYKEGLAHTVGAFYNVFTTGNEETWCADLVRTIPAEMLGHLILQMLSPDLTIDKHRWLAIAEILGPDHAQALYRAAVFVTKVA